MMLLFEETTFAALYSRKRLCRPGGPGAHPGALLRPATTAENDAGKASEGSVLRSLNCCGKFWG
jgi:hypothetical protein